MMYNKSLEIFILQISVKSPASLKKVKRVLNDDTK